MVGLHAGNLPRTHLPGGLVAPARSRAPQPPTGTLALDQLPCRPGGERRRSLCACDAAAQGLPSPLLRATHGQPSTIPSRQAHAGRRPRRPRTTAARRSHCAQRGRSAARAIQAQRGADSAAAEPRTPEARPSGHLDSTGRVDIGRVDTGRPLVRLDGRPHGGQRTRTGRRSAWPVSGHPGHRRHRWAARPRPGRSVWGAWPPITAAMTTPAPRPWSPPLNNCAAPPARPRLGALLSSDQMGGE
jgi:hypothetical protein